MTKWFLLLLAQAVWEQQPYPPGCDSAAKQLSQSLNAMYPQYQIYCDAFAVEPRFAFDLCAKHLREEANAG